MIVVFVHGWSVTHTETYGGLPEALAAQAAAAGLDLEVRHLHLGRYVSFHDEVTVGDLARAFDAALRADLPNNANGRVVFSCITHSTGGPVVREWVERYHGEDLSRSPLRHLVMLAPANHGSALAQLGKSRLGRIASFFKSIEPGVQVLRWLELGSDGQWELQRRWLDARPQDSGFFPFVLTGQTIDSKLFDHLNSYTGEVGSDGVVRVSAANMNYRHVFLRQTDRQVPGKRQNDPTSFLDPDLTRTRRSPRVPLGIIPGAAHSGDKIGIMRSVSATNAGTKPVVGTILRCLGVTSAADYKAVGTELDELTQRTQATEGIPRCAMIVFDVRDDQGDPITEYDMLLLAGLRYDPDKLPKGFFVDRQMNSLARHRLVYYLNCDVMHQVLDGQLGFRIVARPREGFSYFHAGEFRSDDAGIPVTQLLTPNETLYVEVVLRRRVDRETFRLDPATNGPSSFKRVKPGGEIVA